MPAPGEFWAGTRANREKEAPIFLLAHEEAQKKTETDKGGSEPRGGGRGIFRQVRFKRPRKWHVAKTKTCISASKGRRGCSTLAQTQEAIKGKKDGETTLPADGGKRKSKTTQQEQGAPLHPVSNIGKRGKVEGQQFIEAERGSNLGFGHVRGRLLRAPEDRRKNGNCSLGVSNRIGFGKCGVSHQKNKKGGERYYLAVPTGRARGGMGGKKEGI